jgi:hypothetical protein
LAAFSSIGAQTQDAFLLGLANRARLCCLSGWRRVGRSLDRRDVGGTA